jgi:broad specificity phosphatase PhoE
MSATTRVMLVRHGATTTSAEDRFAGSVDIPLSGIGREQAARLGQRLAGCRLTALYTSPMSRARDTASLIGDGRNLVPTIVPELRETDHGHWEQLTRAEVEAAFGDEYQAWERDPFTFAPTGGETGLQVLARSLPALLDIVRRHPGEEVVVVSHKATIRLLLCHILGFEPRGYRDKLDQSPCGLNILDYAPGGRVRLILYNDVSHYATVPGPVGPRLSPWWA